MFLAFFERFVAILAILYGKITIWYDYNVGLFEEWANEKKKFIYNKKFLITQLSNNDQIFLNKLGLGVLKLSSRKDWNSVILNGDVASIRDNLMP